MAATSDRSADAADGSRSVEAETEETSVRATVVLPGQRRTGAEHRSPAIARRAPLGLAAFVNALWAALVSFLPMLGIVAAVTLVGPSRPPLGPTFRSAIAAWLLAHGVPLVVGGQPLALVPLALTGVAAWRCLVAGRNTARALGMRRARNSLPAFVVAISVAVGYGLVGAGLAALARQPGLEVEPVRAGLTLGGFALVAAFLGAWTGTASARRLRIRLPVALRDGVRAAVVAVLVLLGIGATAVGVSIAVAGSTATAMLHNMHLTFVSDVGLVLVCLAYAPNLAVWASAYLAGPGFTLGRVPELPVFAGLPTDPVTGPGLLLLGTPVLAGVGAGVLLARRVRRLAERNGEPLPQAGRLALAAIVSAPAAAVVLGLVGYAAAGPLGSAALANTGQVGWQYAVIGGIGTGFGVLVGGLAAGLAQVRPRP